MLVKQISVFVENKPGKIADILKVLGDNNIDIGALALADTTDFGILRMIVNDADAAKKLLRDVGYVVKTTDVIAVSMEDRAGGLAEVLDVVKADDNTIEYMYAFATREASNAMAVLRVGNPENALNALQKAGVKIANKLAIFG